MNHEKTINRVIAAITSSIALIPVLITVSVLSSSCATATSGGADTVSGPSPAVKTESVITDEIEPLTELGRVLVVYFSQGNATRIVAEDLAALTRADIEVIVEKKKRTGFFGYMGAGMHATFKSATPIDEPANNPARYDVVLVCTPVWSWSLSPPIRTWLRLFNSSIRKAAFITVSGDTEPDKIVKSMIKESGVEPYAFVGFSERDFYVQNRDGYIKKLKAVIDPLRSSHR